jgi:hypothetical protein
MFILPWPLRALRLASDKGRTSPHLQGAPGLARPSFLSVNFDALRSNIMPQPSDLSLHFCLFTRSCEKYSLSEIHNWYDMFVIFIATSSAILDFPVRLSALGVQRSTFSLQ